MLPGFHVHAVVLTVVAIALLPVFPSPSFAIKCARKCGYLNIVYPFYVTNGSNIEESNPACGLHGHGIECDGQTNALIKLGSHKYKVLDLSIGVIRILPGCNTTNLHTFDLTNTPFTISTMNILQLYNCNRNQCSNNCSTFVDFKKYSCKDNNSGEPCCESLESLSKKGLEALTKGYKSLKTYTSRYGCTKFSSWAYSNPESFSFHMDYGLNLEWSVQGNCDCSQNAKCQKRNKGYTCHCNPPYVGDGYNVNGFRCQLGAHEGNKKSMTLKTVTLLCGLIVILTILGATIVSAASLCRSKKRCFSLSRGIISDNYRRGDVHIFGPLLSGMEVFTYKQLDKGTKGFASTEKLGNGACGAVYAANLDDGRRVAVKKLHYFNTQLGYQQTVNELSVLCTVNHRNLVRLLGCCTESAEPLLVFEYVSNGTLAEHLQGERGEGLDWFTRLTIAAETADALAYLHSMDPPILHRDVKSRNILLDHDFNTKVADFGLSRMGHVASVDGSHISTIPQGTPGYLDPEYHQNFHLSDKSDVYSFGVVLIEIITALKPVDFSREKKEVNLAALAVAKIGSGCLDDIIDKSLEAHRRPSVKTMVQRVAELAFRCLSYDKDARPSMREVLEELLLIRGTAVSPVMDVSGKDSPWTVAQTLQQCDSGSSMPSSETERFLMSKHSHVFSPVKGLQVISENKKRLEDVKRVSPMESKHSKG